MTGKRIVVIDGHIIAQFNQYGTGWWTCSRSDHGDELRQLARSLK